MTRQGDGIKKPTGCEYVCYLAVCGIGHAPHCGYNGERSRGLIGALLPGHRVIQEGAVTAADGEEAELV